MYALPHLLVALLVCARSHRDILETIAWINRDLAATPKAHSPLPAVLDKGVAGFRAQAEAIIK
ncbi:hypothetical protein [Candidatus Palauibacter sp.]|uniref:hypothetical protein n=1 Tax=Candidatus Palauibacter sp. TaxID=3101350 RepID=UPI003B5B4B5C